MAYNPRDYYFKKSKEEKYLARSVYKLQEIDQKFNLFQKGQKIIDLGASPGSWTQYVLRMIGPEGKAVAIDLKPIKITDRRLIFLQDDILCFSIGRFKKDLERIIGGGISEDYFDGLVADLAPMTSGIKELDVQKSFELTRKSFEIAKIVLKPGGFWVSKIFESPAAHHLSSETRNQFSWVNLFKPQASRKNSREIYLVGLKLIK